MRQIVLTISSEGVIKSGSSFEITLNITSWTGFSGKWSCLPGFLATTSGFFTYNPSINVLYLYDRQMAFTENVKFVLSDPANAKSPNQMLGALEGFDTSNLVVGKQWVGDIFGLAGDVSRSRLHRGTLTNMVWQIKSAN